MSINKLFYTAAMATLLVLAGCRRGLDEVPQTQQFNICPEALATLPEYGALQGLDGWFYFYKGLTRTTQNYELVDMMVDVKGALLARGIELVVLPLPNRALVAPQHRNLDDPPQAQYDPVAAAQAYRSYLNSLTRAGVHVVDALSTMRNFDASGEQTFFKRDVHWTPEGAKAVAQDVATVVRQLPVRLSKTAIFAKRNLPDNKYYGQYVNTWTQRYCGYRLPPEPKARYSFQPDTSDDERAEVVKTGTSFSIGEYDPGFLSEALQTPVLNEAIGGGGMLFSLETYLRSDTFANHKPKVIVWEFFVTTDYLVEQQQRRLVAAANGVCDDKHLIAEQRLSLDSTTPVTASLKAVAGHDHYLTFSFSDHDVTVFMLGLNYNDGTDESLNINTPRPDNKQGNKGRFFTTLASTDASFKQLTIELQKPATGYVDVQLCRILD